MNFLKGRTNRATYWLSVGILVVLVAILAMIAPDNTQVSEIVLVFLCVPRLHDIGRTGWWVAAAIALEILGVIAAFVLLSGDDVLPGMGLVTLAIFGLVIWLGCIPGDAGPNRFGEAPRRGIPWGKAPGRA